MHHMATSLVRQGIDQAGAIHGDGYEIVASIPGRCFSYRLFGEKMLANARVVRKYLYMPGPFDAAAGLNSKIEEIYSVWVGWEEYNPQFEALYDALPPSITLPAAAYRWSDNAFDGPPHWYAEFGSAEDAEAFALTLLAATDDEPALQRSSTFLQ